jgi:hypothetical protein
VTVATTSSGPHHLSLRVDCAQGSLTNLVSTGVGTTFTVLRVTG